MKRTVFWILISVYFWQAQAQTPVDYVSTLVGTQSKHSLSTGNTYPAIALPWGMNFWTPQTGKMGDGWAYTYDADKIRGFKQTHQPSPWINDYGQFSIMPVTGKRVTASGDARTFNEDDRASWFSHKAEIAKPYYYRVYLADHDVVTEITPTERAALFRFTFPESKKEEYSFVVIDAFDRGSCIKIIPEENKVIGYTTKNSGGVPENFKNYFVIVFDRPFSYQGITTRETKQGAAHEAVHKEAHEAALNNRKDGESDHSSAVIGFPTRKGEIVHARVASSFISFEQAELNLRELGNRSFDEVQKAGKDRWNEVLGRITVEDSNIDHLRTFYSCLYRSVLFPRSFYEYDANGQVVHYSPYNGQVLPGYLFTDTGFWDTFRCLFPLLNLLYPEMNKQMQEGLLNVYRESGFFPEWASPGHRDCMVGNNSASVLVDAYLQGIKVDDTETLWKGITYTATHRHPKISSTGRQGYEYYDKLGYIPCDVKINESAARTLEYAYDDWCIYRLGKALGKPESETGIYAERSWNYRNLFNKKYNLMAGKKQNGEFAEPFSPFKWGGDFTEGNALHYTWSVFHDPQGLVNLMGGAKTFNAMLDTVFSLPPVFDESYYGGVIHEIREMQIMNMGNYAHGNQPIQHMIYMYNYSGEPWKAQYHLRQVMDKMYTAAPDGYCGDEDNGQTSAWYVFSALGFYPVCPGSGQYVLGSPLFAKAKLHLSNGKTVDIQSNNNNSENVYIKSLKLNGKNSTHNFLEIETLKQGAKLLFEMDGKPNIQRGTAPGDFPYSMTPVN